MARGRRNRRRGPPRGARRRPARSVKQERLDVYSFASPCMIKPPAFPPAAKRDVLIKHRALASYKMTKVTTSFSVNDFKNEIPSYTDVYRIRPLRFAIWGVTSAEFTIEVMDGDTGIEYSSIAGSDTARPRVGFRPGLKQAAWTNTSNTSPYFALHAEVGAIMTVAATYELMYATPALSSEVESEGKVKICRPGRLQSVLGGVTNPMAVEGPVFYDLPSVSDED